MQNKIIDILQQEMVPALGCTEPIAIAYAASLVTKHLGDYPERLIAQCSANIVKNVKSVIVPNSGGMKGIDAATVIGAYGGDPDKKLEVLAKISPEQITKAQALLTQGICKIELLESPTPLHIVITGFQKENQVIVEIKESHTNVTLISKNGEVIYATNDHQDNEEGREEGTALTIEEVIKFARFGDYSTIVNLLDQSIEFNTKIAEEGLKNSYGLEVGKSLLTLNGDNVINRARAFAAAGSDARMSGCDLPVVINSGSGNQGLTVSLPVVEYAKALKRSKDELYRALILSNLTAICVKQFIGKLSAYCGVVCAASGAAAGIAYLQGGNDQQIEDAITNTLGTLSGMICDGAKPSCASKIATSIETAIMSCGLAMQGNVLKGGDGIIKDNLDHTLKAVGCLACKGMQTTDKTILDIMLDK